MLLEHLFYHRCMTFVAGDVSGLPVDCSCGWRGRIGECRGHLVRQHCNVEGCFAVATVLVSFGYRERAFRLVGARVGICARHRGELRPGRMHMIVEEFRR
jgi:hypothetical protein